MNESTDRSLACGRPWKPSIRRILAPLTAADRQCGDHRHGRFARAGTQPPGHGGADRARCARRLSPGRRRHPPARARRRRPTRLAARGIRGDHLGGAGRMPRRGAVREHERSRAFRARPACGRAEPRGRREAGHGQPHPRLARLRHRAQRERARDGRGAGGADARRRDPARARGIRLGHGERGAAPAPPWAHPRAALREPDARRPPHRARDDARALAPRRLPAARRPSGLRAASATTSSRRTRSPPSRAGTSAPASRTQRACRPATRR